MSSAGIEDEILKKLEDEQLDERLSAVELLGEAGTPEAAKMLIKVLRDDPERAVKEAAVLALSSFNDPFVVEELIPFLKDEDPFFRNTAAEIIQYIGDPAKEIIVGLLKDPDPDVRMFAIRILGEGNFSSSSVMLRKVVLEDPDINVVGCAIEYLGEVGCSHEDVEAVMSALQKFKDPYIEFAVETALYKLGGEE